MAYDFPANPVAGQEYVPPAGGQTYIWNSPRWLVKGVPPVGGEVIEVGIGEAPIDANQYGRANGTWSVISPNHTWATLPGKPVAFPPDPHSHTQADVVGLPAALSAKEAFVALGTTQQFWRGDKTWQTIPAQDWTSIVNKPATFPATAHIHPQTDVTNLVTDLAGKAPISHTHTIADVTTLAGTLASKEPAISAGTTAQFWRGDKTWQSVPAGDWSALTGKPATFVPSAHIHVMTDITNLQTTLDTKSAVGHLHDYASLTAIPNSFPPTDHVHALSDILNLVPSLADKAPLASPVFTGTVTLPVTNVLGALTGTSAAFSSTVTAISSYYVKPSSTAVQNVHLWFYGPANEDRAVLYTPAAALGSFTIRVGGTQNYTFSSAGLFTAPGGVSSTTGNFTGLLHTNVNLTVGTTITAGTGISTTNGHITANDYVYSQAGYFIGSPTLAVIGTAASSVGDVALRPAGYNTSAYQTVVDGATGQLISTGHQVANTGRHIGTATTVVLANNGTGAGTVYLRPNGEASGVGQMTVSSAGDVQVYRNLDTNGSMTANQNFTSATAALCLYCTSATGTIYLRPNNAATTEQAYYQYNGNFVIGNQGYKAVAGSWAAASDGRIKTVIGDYEPGLKEILQLKVRRYTYKGNEVELEAPAEDDVVPYKNSPHHRAAVEEQVHVSLIAQEAEEVMPDLVTRSEAWIDGEKVDDFRTLNPTNVTWALVNAIQELTARLETLEGKTHEHSTGTD